MLGLVILVLIGGVFVFAFVIMFGAPYLPTLREQAETAVDLLNLKEGQTMLELGAGDGTVALVALKRGIKVTAIELNPILCAVIWLRTIRYRKKIHIKCANFWTTQWGEYDGLYVFLLDKYMPRLDKLIIQQNKNVNLASFTFTIPGKNHITAKQGVFLYEYTAR